MADKPVVVNFEMHTSEISTAVNTIMSALQHTLKLSPLKALFVLAETSRHIEKISGIKIESSNAAFEPDVKFDGLVEN
jgi:hypothetical protein